jgi:hypothetical protein
VAAYRAPPRGDLLRRGVPGHRQVHRSQGLLDGILRHPYGPDGTDRARSRHRRPGRLRTGDGGPDTARRVAGRHPREAHRAARPARRRGAAPHCSRNRLAGRTARPAAHRDGGGRVAARPPAVRREPPAVRPHRPGGEPVATHHRTAGIPGRRACRGARGPRSRRARGAGARRRHGPGPARGHPARPGLERGGVGGRRGTAALARPDRRGVGRHPARSPGTGARRGHHRPAGRPAAAPPRRERGGRAARRPGAVGPAGAGRETAAVPQPDRAAPAAPIRTRDPGPEGSHAARPYPARRPRRSARHTWTVTDSGRRASGTTEHTAAKAHQVETDSRRHSADGGTGGGQHPEPPSTRSPDRSRAPIVARRYPATSVRSREGRWHDRGCGRGPRRSPDGSPDSTRAGRRSRFRPRRGTAGGAGRPAVRRTARRAVPTTAAAAGR